ncbi:MAG TPA: hypothetical protein VMU48_15305 [Terracidiphilus sp.]|nr:hypothetical protein [Terracidiphilus sp.]
MSRALELVQIVESRGGRLSIEGQTLAIDPRAAGEPFIPELRAHKAAIIELLQARQEEAFTRWLAFACAFNGRWFTNMAALHRSFSAWQAEHGAAPPSLAEFKQLLVEQDLLVAEVADVTLTSGLGFKNDIEAIAGFDDMPANMPAGSAPDAA